MHRGYLNSKLKCFFQLLLKLIKGQYLFIHGAFHSLIFWYYAVTALGKLLTRMCLCNKQYNLVPAYGR